jgi:WD40 repeat protein
MTLQRKRYLCLAVLLAVPVVLGLVLREQMSWRPRVFKLPIRVESVAFSSDGELLATTPINYGHRKMQCYGMQSGQLRWEHEVDIPRALYPCAGGMVLTDGKTIGVFRGDLLGVGVKTTAEWWNLKDKGRRRVLQLTPGCAPVTFSPDGRYAITLERAHNSPPTECRILVWEAPHRVPIHQPTPRQQPLHKLRVQLPGYKVTDLSAAAFSRDGRTFALGINYYISVSRQHPEPSPRLDEIAVWDLTTGHQERRFRKQVPSNGKVEAVAVSPDGALVATVVGRDITLYNVRTGRQQQLASQYTDNTGPLCFSPDGSLLASGSIDSTIRLWDVQRGNCVRTLRGMNTVINTLVFAPDGRTLAAVDNNIGIDNMYVPDDPATAWLWRIR